MKRITVYTSEVDGFGGQAMVTRKVIELVRQKDALSKVIDLKTGGKYYFKTFIASIAHLLFFLKQERNLVYFTPTRNGRAILKDLPVYFAAIRGIMVLAHVHGNDLEQLFNLPIVGRFILKVYRSRILIILPTGYLVEKYQREFGLRCKLVENYVPCNISIQADMNRAKSNYPSIVWNSNLMITKGILHFLNILSTLQTSVGLRSIPINIMGLIPKDKLHDLVVSGINEVTASNKSCSYHGELSREATWLHMNPDAIVFLLSPSECQPLAIIDAMVMQCYIVVSDIPELRSLLSNYEKAFFVKLESQHFIKDVNLILDCIINSPGIEVDNQLDRFSELRFEMEILKIFDES